LKTDPQELQNLYASEDLEPLRQKLETRLRKWMAEVATP
jgi:hypothetical protein